MKTNTQVYNWLKRYTHNFKNEYYMGLCVDLAEELVQYLNDDNYQQWELYDIAVKQKYNRLPLVIPDSMCGTFPPLSDWKDADFFHVVIKYNGYFWDGSGQHKSLRTITKHYTQCPNPHWFQT